MAPKIKGNGQQALNIKSHAHQILQSRRYKAVLLVCGLLASLAAIASLLLYGFVYGGHVEVMRVNGQPVTRDEFSFYMSMKKSDVTNYFYQTYGASAGKGFWTETYGGECPADVLKERAREACVQDKIIQALALDYGITDDISFKGFLSRFEANNKERRQRAEKGEVLYGVVEFTKLQYYLQVMSDLKTELQDKAENIEVSVSRDEVQALYNERYDVYNNNRNNTIAELHIPFVTDSMLRDAVQANAKALPMDDAYALILQIRQELEEGADFDQLCQNYTGEEPLEMTIAMDEAANSPSSTMGILARNTVNLQNGGYSQPFQNGFGFSIVKMVDKETEQNIPFDDAYNNLYNTVLAEKFEKFLAREASSADVADHAFILGFIHYS